MKRQTFIALVFIATAIAALIVRSITRDFTQYISFETSLKYSMVVLIAYSLALFYLYYRRATDTNYKPLKWFSCSVFFMNMGASYFIPLLLQDMRFAFHFMLSVAIVGFLNCVLLVWLSIKKGAAASHAKTY